MIEGALDFESSRLFHVWEAEPFVQAKVDFIYAALIPALDEAAGIAAAFQDLWRMLRN